MIYRYTLYIQKYTCARSVADRQQFPSACNKFLKNHRSDYRKDQDIGLGLHFSKSTKDCFLKVSLENITMQLRYRELKLKNILFPYTLDRH